MGYVPVSPCLLIQRPPAPQVLRLRHAGGDMGVAHVFAAEYLMRLRERAQPGVGGDLPFRIDAQRMLKRTLHALVARRSRRGVIKLPLPWRHTSGATPRLICFSCFPPACVIPRHRPPP